jgi:hypothetical protein
MPRAHACNPSYSGGRDQEDCGSKPARANRSVRPYLEKTYHKKRASGVAQGVSPEFKTQVLQKKKKVFKFMETESIMGIMEVARQ